MKVLRYAVHRQRPTDFLGAFLGTSRVETDTGVAHNALIDLAPRPGLEPSMWAWLSTPPIQIFLVPCVCLVATSFYRGVHRILKAGVVELPGPLPGPPSIRAAVKGRSPHTAYAQSAGSNPRYQRAPSGNTATSRVTRFERGRADLNCSDASFIIHRQASSSVTATFARA